MSSNETRTGDEICPMCKRPKSRHTPEEIKACTKKINEFNNTGGGGAGIN